MARSGYHERLEAKAERHAELAEKRAAESDAQWDSHEARTLRDMAGEPIKIGHHSERRHRRLYQRVHEQGRKAVELGKKAEYHRRAAANAAVRAETVIDADNPDAVELMREKIAQLEAKQDRMKKINAAFRKWKKKPESLATSGLSESDQKFVASYQPPDHSPYLDMPFADYELRNNNANIRRCKKRLESLERVEARENSEVEGDGFVVFKNADENRLQIIFRGKPSESVRGYLKKRGFRWSPRAGAWQRHLHTSGSLADELLEALPGLMKSVN